MREYSLNPRKVPITEQAIISLVYAFVEEHKRLPGSIRANFRDCDDIAEFTRFNWEEKAIRTAAGDIPLVPNFQSETVYLEM